ncbi:MAG: radical SAM protein [Vampirovibrionales bacterium]
MVSPSDMLDPATVALSSCSVKGFRLEEEQGGVTSVLPQKRVPSVCGLVVDEHVQHWRLDLPEEGVSSEMAHGCHETQLQEDLAFDACSPEVWLSSWEQQLTTWRSLVSTPKTLQCALGVQLERYPSTQTRVPFTPLKVKHRRGMARPLLNSFWHTLTRQVPSPLMLTHIVTTRCNYSCNFCSFADSLNAKHQELTLEEVRGVYATMGSNLNVIVYSGGETTLHKQLEDIIEAAYELTPVQSVYIISNAWNPERLLQITHRIMQRCPELHLTWSLSIEGFKAYNNQVRFTKAHHIDAWQHTIDTLFALKHVRETFGYTHLDVQLCTVCTPENHAFLPLWYAMVKDVLRPDKWNLNLMRRSVQMTESALPTFQERRKQASLEPFEQTYIQLTEQLKQDVLQGTLEFMYHTQTPMEGAMKASLDLLSQQENRHQLQGLPSLFCCRAGTQGAYLGSQGEVAGCEEFAMHPSKDYLYGNIRDYQGDFQALWHSTHAQALRQLTHRAPQCQGCSLESQKNYPSALVSLPRLLDAYQLAQTMLSSP